ncbi:MAG: NAD-binding protein [Clostridiales bacterium]|nr:NAD-binding protein [Clostridiales bacterium]
MTAHFFADRDVIVAGGGDTAVEDAMYLASICKSVTLMLRGTAFRAAKSRVDKTLALPNVSAL